MPVKSDSPSAAGATLRVSADVLAQWVGDRVVLVHLITNKIFELNESASRVWVLASEGRSSKAIVSALLLEYDADEDTVAAEVVLFLNGLVDDGFLTC